MKLKKGGLNLFGAESKSLHLTDDSLNLYATTYQRITYLTETQSLWYRGTYDTPYTDYLYISSFGFLFTREVKNEVKIVS